MVQTRAQREADWFAVDRVILCAWHPIVHAILWCACLLYTSDAADE